MRFDRSGGHAPPVARHLFPNSAGRSVRLFRFAFRLGQRGIAPLGAPPPNEPRRQFEITERQVRWGEPVEPEPGAIGQQLPYLDVVSLANVWTGPSRRRAGGTRSLAHGSGRSGTQGLGFPHSSVHVRINVGGLRRKLIIKDANKTESGSNTN